MTSTDEHDPTAAPVRVTFLTEQHVGLRTYSENLRRFADRDPRIEASWTPITYESSGGWFERLTFLPSGIVGAMRGREQVRRSIAATHPDACLYLTQTPAALGGRAVASTPYVIMLDDTPRLFDGMAEHYESPPDRFRALRAWKHRINVRALRAASVVAPMSEWARRSLLDDYGVAPERAVVVPTGIDLDAWHPGDRGPSERLRVLFVGGDFRRKGGSMLLDAVERAGSERFDLHIVTRSELTDAPGRTVYRDMNANTRELMELFRSCDLFVLPSNAEAYPNVVIEACASGLACIVTNVGGMAEMVDEGVSGHVIEAGDVDGLARHLGDLADDRERCNAMGRAAREHAEAAFDGAANARRIVDYLLASVR